MEITPEIIRSIEAGIAIGTGRFIAAVPEVDSQAEDARGLITACLGG